MGTVSFPGVKWPGRGVDHQPPSGTEVKERVELYLFSSSGPSLPVIGRVYLYLYLLYVCFKRKIYKVCDSEASD
jgi:hypothetical protein